ncbi:DUF5333 domain-containing protein [Mesobacterium sp. TK19101]|uniref:DUF5333 domain-containing protein n=1 Tax=Mesobacterium hydrothermale TaxID=3111907 RepID=A0ABU6HCC5_9RHOB|nr:DUF5333 domain-containing protein [Mesobacterium sp. TK19101]MEC3860041.1 DUF5333 domain-containing protein [Mesobacterium sp. TK19101]
MKRLLTGALVAALLAGQAHALPPLREVKQIDDGLLAVAIADELRKRCDTLDARMFRALNYLSSLKDAARGLGYSDAEIEAYVSSKSEKDRMRARGEAYLKTKGVTIGDYAAYCTLGEDEIARGSAIGKLLRVK